MTIDRGRWSAARRTSTSEPTTVIYSLALEANIVQRARLPRRRRRVVRAQRPPVTPSPSPSSSPSPLPSPSHPPPGACTVHVNGREASTSARISTSRDARGKVRRRAAPAVRLARQPFTVRPARCAWLIVAAAFYRLKTADSMGVATQAEVKCAIDSRRTRTAEPHVPRRCCHGLSNAGSGRAHGDGDLSRSTPRPRRRRTRLLGDVMVAYDPATGTMLTASPALDAGFAYIPTRPGNHVAGDDCVPQAEGRGRRAHLRGLVGRLCERHHAVRPDFASLSRVRAACGGCSDRVRRDCGRRRWAGGGCTSSACTGKLLIPAGILSARYLRAGRAGGVRGPRVAYDEPRGPAPRRRRAILCGSICTASSTWRPAAGDGRLRQWRCTELGRELLGSVSPRTR